MNFRNTVLLAIITAGIGGFVYFYEIRGAPGRNSAEEKKTLLFPNLLAEDIDWIELSTTDKREARVERKGEGWELVRPLVYKGDAVALDGLARAATTLKFDRKFSEPEILETYGLNRVPNVRFASNGREYSFTIGDETPLGGSMYLSSGNDQGVFSAKTFEVSPFEKSLSELRDRRVVSFERDDIEQIAINWPDSQTILVKSEKEWNMEAPVQTRGDRNSVESLLSQVQFLRTMDFIDEPGKAERDTLLEPSFSVTFKESGGNVHRLRIGQAVDTRRLVQVNDKATLFSVSSDVVADLPQNVVSLRYREVGRFSAVEAKAFELVFRNIDGAQELSVSGDRDEGSWATNPQMAPGKASRFLSSLAGLVAIDVEAENAPSEGLSALGLSPPRVSLVVRGDVLEGERADLAHIELGRVDADRGIIARIKGEGTIYRLHYDLAEDIPVSAQAFRNRFAAEEEGKTSGDDPSIEPESMD